MREIDQRELDNLLNDGKSFILDFSATWCAPCRMMTPILEELSKENQDVPIYKIDADVNRDAVSSHGVRGIPCIIAFKDGDELERNVGAAPKSKLQNLINKLK